MNLSAPFIKRPIATILLTIGLALSGVAGFLVLPVAPLPMVDLPVISVSASLPGASPVTMAADVATPLERRLGSIAGVNEITSQSSVGRTQIVLQFDISKNIDAVKRSVHLAHHLAAQSGIGAMQAGRIDQYDLGVRSIHNSLDPVARGLRA